jgi:hypothetical protein
MQGDRAEELPERRDEQDESRPMERQIARMAGVRVPIVPMSHQYVVTEALTPRPGKPLPTLRDPDLLVYFRPEVDGLVMGGYLRHSVPRRTAAGRPAAADPPTPGTTLTVRSSARRPAGNGSTGTRPTAGSWQRPRGWAGRYWSPAIGVEHEATRTTARPV